MSIAPRFARAIARGLGSPRLARAALSLVLAGCALVSGAGAASASNNAAAAPHGEHIFSARFDGSSTIRVAADSQSNLFIAGTFEGFLTLGGVRLMSEGASDIFVAKLDVEGRVLWATRVGGAGAQYGLAVAADADGNVIVAGSSQTPTKNGFSLVPVGSRVFAAKLSPDGQPLFTTDLGSAHSGIGLGVAASEDGDVTITGRFNGVLELDNDVLKSSQDAPNGDAFVLRLTPSGKTRWARVFGGLNDQYGSSVVASSKGGVVVSGMFVGDLDLDGKLLSSPGKPSAFVTALDATGAVSWSVSLGSTLTDLPRLAGGPSGDVVIAGTFEDHLEFAGTSLSAAGSDDVFAIRVTAEGHALFVQRFGDIHSQQLGGVAADAKGGVALAVSSIGDTDFGAGPLACGGGYDVAVVKLSDLGEAEWSRGFGDEQDQFASDVAIDASGNILLAGQFTGDLDLGGPQLTSATGFDLFVGALTP